MDLPAGTITLVFTDIVESSELSERYGAEFEPLRKAHFRILRDAKERWHGFEVSSAGDSLFLSFMDALDAVLWAIDVQRALAQFEWPTLSSEEGEQTRVEIRIRIGMHSGEPFLSQGSAPSDYYGPVVNRAARIAAGAHGGQILLSDATCQKVRSSVAADIELVDCGRHRLKGVGEERIWQVHAPGLIESFPPLNTLDPQRHNLPAPQTPYVGRDQSIKAWYERLRDPETRVLTLSGFGGMGKTRTALQLAELSLDDYADGIWWVETEEAHTADEVFQRVAKALRLPPQAEMPVREQVNRYLSERHLLLVLDNTEQITDAGRAVKEMLDRAPNIKLIVTTRRALEIRAERIVEIGSMTTSDAVQLFVNRVRDRQPGFELTPDISVDVEELTWRLDGIPLALELAASRIAMMAPRQMLQRVSERFKLLQSRAPDLPDRQRALRAAIDWSYDLLTDEAKSLFAQVSVFAGSFGLEDAEAVCEAADVLEGIAELRAHSLLQTEAISEAAEARLVMLTSLREYAQERLDAGPDGRAARLRHARYFLEYANRQLARMRTPEEPDAIRKLKVTADNMRAALTSAQAEGEPELFARLGQAYGSSLWRRGYAEEAVRPIEAALAALYSRNREPAALCAELLADRAWVYLMNRQEIDLALRLTREALELFRSANDRLGLARTDNVLGYAYWLQGNYAESRACFKDALARLQSPEDDIEIANILSTFGIMVAGEPGGDPAEATQYLEEAIRLRRKLGDRRGLGEALTNLGILAYREANWPQAWAHYAEALEHERALSNAFGIARTLYNLAEVAEVYSDMDRALRLAAAAERLMEVVKSPLVGLTTDLLARIADEAGVSAEIDTLRQECAKLDLDRLVEWATA